MSPAAGPGGAGRRVPSSTYRLQLQPSFGFVDAAGLADYLADLGVSHLYASPYLQAAPGSTHGYDVVDHRHANDELGGEAGRTTLVAALNHHGLGQILDVVPNHMSVASPRHNRWWWDVLEHGSASPYAGWFDIDWDNPSALRDERGRLLVPVLGAGEGELATLELVTENGELLLAYYDHRFPVAAGTAVPGDDARAVHERQHYRLTSWRVGNDELNYRRFFDVTGLAAIRVEDARVFAETHAVLLDWLTRGELDGLRIDHPDGLADPVGYVRRLAESAPGAWIVVEKILEPGERLPSDWPVAGTTGYDAMRDVSGLAVDQDAREALTAFYAEFTGAPGDYGELVHELKKAAAGTVLYAETARLSALLARLGVVDHWRKAAPAMTELLACFPVYRTYLRPGWPGDDTQLLVLDSAIAEASLRRPVDAELYASIEKLAREAVGGLAGEFIRRLQQTTGMVMAKGVEDTAFYRYHRLVALNEVGGDPGRFGTSVAEFHENCRARQRDWPDAMTALSTHDTKRSEDVRARIAALSEIPEAWFAAVRRWHEAASDHRGPTGPDPNTEYLFWQTLVGAWPISADRLTAYLRKATHEAKEHTSWVSPDEAYDHDLEAFAVGVLGDGGLLADIAAFTAPLIAAGRRNSLAHKLIQLTMPGVPDVYQGSECWDLSLVDPDNRRPVDFAARRALLARLDADGAALPSLDDDTGAAKLLVVSRTLRLRRAHPEWFGAQATYEPLAVEGPAADHLVGFTRAGRAVTIAPRLPLRLAGSGGWRGTTIQLPSAGRWRDVLTGLAVETGADGRVPVTDVLTAFPVALLVRTVATSD